MRSIVQASSTLGTDLPLKENTFAIYSSSK